MLPTSNNSPGSSSSKLLGIHVGNFCNRSSPKQIWNCGRFATQAAHARRCGLAVLADIMPSPPRAPRTSVCIAHQALSRMIMPRNGCITIQSFRDLTSCTYSSGHCFDVGTEVTQPKLVSILLRRERWHAPDNANGYKSSKLGLPEE